MQSDGTVATRPQHRVAYDGFDEDQRYWHDLEWRPAAEPDVDLTR